VKKLFLLLLLCISVATTHAQRGWEVGGSIGASHYFGDLNTSFQLKLPGVAAGVAARRNFNERVCAKLGFNYANIAGNDALSRNDFEFKRNLNFKSLIFEGVFQLEFNFLPYMHGSRDNFYTPYLFGGVNVFYFNPRTKYEGKTYSLREYGTEGQFYGDEYYSLQGGLAYGAGFKIDLTYDWSLNFDISMRRLYTDYLDDVSTVYPDVRDLGKIRGATSVALSDRSLPDAEGIKLGQRNRQRGDSNSADSYGIVSVGLLYYFGDLKCPGYGSNK
jgi:Domain of unknown function (DUF6089)